MSARIAPADKDPTPRASKARMASAGLTAASGALRRLALCLAVCGIGLATASPAPGAANWKRVCLDHLHQGVGIHKFKATATRMAFAEWAAAVDGHDGAIWVEQKTGGAACQHVTVGNTLPWRCVIDRRPCRMVRTDAPPSSVPVPGPNLPSLQLQN